jgi:hypothetical protein
MALAAAMFEEGIAPSLLVASGGNWRKRSIKL